MDIYLILIIVLAALLLLAFAILTIVFIKKHKKKEVISEFPNLLEALGGISNIVDSTYKGSRVSVVVNDKKIVDKEKIKTEGIETIVVSNKKITMVVDNTKATLISNYLSSVNKKDSE